jgi:intracellular multiplication protein IcmE
VSINAVAINPDTASTALASKVDHHYLVRWGSLFAANFISGYAKAVSQSGSTVMNNTGTTTTSKGNYSPTDKMLMGFGKIGDKMSQVAGKWVDKPPTVSIDAGVGLGILFLDDVAASAVPEKKDLK